MHLFHLCRLIFPFLKDANFKTIIQIVPINDRIFIDMQIEGLSNNLENRSILK